MRTEIERKFLLTSLPEGLGEPIAYERHFIHLDEISEIRIQRKGDVFELERKLKATATTSENQKISLTEAEYKSLLPLSKFSILRESHKLRLSPSTDSSIKVYGGAHAGLIRAEVEFSDEEASDSFTPPYWFGPEITDTPLGRDGKLVKLSNNEMDQVIQKVLGKK